MDTWNVRVCMCVDVARGVHLNITGLWIEATEEGRIIYYLDLHPWQVLSLLFLVPALAPLRPPQSIRICMKINAFCLIPVIAYMM